jgi:hypothetical protein
LGGVQWQLAVMIIEELFDSPFLEKWRFFDFVAELEKSAFGSIENPVEGNRFDPNPVVHVFVLAAIRVIGSPGCQ